MALGDDVLLDIQEKAETIFRESLGVDGGDASALALRLKESLRLKWGGQVIYFKKKKDVSDRNHEICRRFNGSNVSELSIEYDLSMQSVYRIVRSAASRGT